MRYKHHGAVQVLQLVQTLEETRRNWKVDKLQYAHQRHISMLYVEPIYALNTKPQKLCCLPPALTTSLT